jgi:hypothetical protein
MKQMDMPNLPFFLSKNPSAGKSYEKSNIFYLRPYEETFPTIELDARTLQLKKILYFIH